MMKSVIGSLKKKQNRAGASAVGVGSGTGLVLIANSMPEDSPIKIVLLLAAPSVSVMFRALFLWAQVEITNYWRDRKLRALADRTKKNCEEALTNPSTSDVHKKKIRAKLEELEMIILDQELGEIRSLLVTIPSDFTKISGATIG